MQQRSSAAVMAGHALPMVAAAPGSGWSHAATRDRLSAMLFLAALVHGVLILGVTFTGQPRPPDADTTSLEVVIVTRDYEKFARPLNSAALLAQQNLVGRGNAPLEARLRTALSGRLELALPGPEHPGVWRPPGPTGGADPAERWLTALAQRLATVRPGEAGIDPAPLKQRPLDVADADPIDILTEPDLFTKIPDADPRELLVSASTRETRIANYLNSWKIRVERVGTLNFPQIAELASAKSFPVLEVAIGADGALREIVVRTSSGYRKLDRAAMNILRLAAPFEPFPQALRKDYDVLRFAYEWRFATSSGAGRVSAPANSR